MGGKCAVHLQQRLFIVRQTGRMLLIGKTKQIIRGSIQIAADLTEQIETEPPFAGEIIAERSAGDLQYLCKSSLGNVLLFHEFADALNRCFHC